MLWFQKYVLGHIALEEQGWVEQNIWSSYFVIMHILQDDVLIVNHDILLSKLDLYGITGRENALNKSDLSDGYQRVLIYHKNHSFITLSKWAKIKHGVTQGSILGPLLFFYVNDLPEIRNNSSVPILSAADISM